MAQKLWLHGRISGFLILSWLKRKWHSICNIFKNLLWILISFRIYQIEQINNADLAISTICLIIRILNVFTKVHVKISNFKIESPRKAQQIIFLWWVRSSIPTTNIGNKHRLTKLLLMCWFTSMASFYHVFSTGQYTG